MNCKKLSSLLLLFLVFGVLLSTSVSAKPLGEMLEDAFDKVLDIANLGYLTEGTPDTDLIAFVRIIVAVLIFTLLYAGLGALGHVLSRNVAIVVAAVLAIMSAIFIPSSVLLAIGAAYGAFFAFLLFGALIVPIALLVFFVPTESRPMALFKLVLLGLAAWIIGQVNSAALEISGGTFGGQIANLGDFSEWVNTITEYAYLVVFVIAAYLVFKLIKPTSGTGEWGGKLKGKLKDRFGKAYSKGGLKGVQEKAVKDIDKVLTGEKKSKKAELSTYIALEDMKNSVKKLDDVKNQADLKRVIGEIRSDENVVRRDEIRGRNRINRLKKWINKAKLPADKKAKAEEIVNEMDILNKNIMKSTEAFDNELRGGWRNFNRKKENLKNAINAVIDQESGLMVEFKKLKKLLK